jgi:hypothetical protein
VKFTLEAGAEAELTPEVHQALEQLARALGAPQADAEGFCGAFKSIPCAADSYC